MSRFQYFLAVVPTIYVDSTGSFSDQILLSNQYAVTEFKREFNETQGIFKITNNSGETGTPGIFMKYELEPISVRVTEYRQNFAHFIARLCSIVGGTKYICRNSNT
jgi:hypothetical protein